MKWLNIYAVATLLLGVVGACTSSKYTMVEEVDAIPLQDALLWKIQGADLDQPSYLFGTMHLISNENFFWPEGMEEAISNADKMVFEIDMDKMSNPLSLLTALPKVLMRNDTTLSMLLSNTEYQEVAPLLTTLKKIPFIERIKPFFLLQILQANPDESDRTPMVSYEKQLYTYAKQYHMPSEGLESIKQQLGFFDSIGYREQALALLDYARNGSEESLDDLEKLYTQEKIDSLWSSVHSEMSGNSAMGRVILSNRNRNWIGKMEKYMRKGPVLFAVGAGHLAGKNGLIPLLIARGYTLIPMRSAAKPRTKI